MEAILPIKKVTVITISSPIKESEIKKLRAVFLKIGWDSQDASNAGLSMFINAKLHPQETHYIDYDHKKIQSSPVKITPIQNHPDFSPDWLEERNFRPQDLINKEFTKDNFKVEKIEFARFIDVQKLRKRKSNH